MEIFALRKFRRRAKRLGDGTDALKMLALPRSFRPRYRRDFRGAKIATEFVAVRGCASNHTADQPNELTIRATIWRRRMGETEPRRSVKSGFGTS